METKRERSWFYQSISRSFVRSRSSKTHDGVMVVDVVGVGVGVGVVSVVVLAWSQYRDVSSMKHNSRRRAFISRRHFDAA
jgi:hypothetical protein